MGILWMLMQLKLFRLKSNSICAPSIEPLQHDHDVMVETVSPILIRSMIKSQIESRIEIDISSPFFHFSRFCRHTLQIFEIADFRLLTHQNADQQWTNNQLTINPFYTKSNGTMASASLFNEQIQSLSGWLVIIHSFIYSNCR